MSTVDRGLLPPELRGLRTFKVYQSDGQPLRPAVDSDSRKAYYKALNRLSKTVADLLESMGREDPRHHDTPLPQRSGLAVYVAETTAELEGARAGLCDDAEKSARTRTDIRRMLAASRGTDGSNPVPSSKESATNLTGKIEPALARNRRFESVSLRHLPTQKENLAGGVAGDAPHVTAKFRAQHSA